VAWSGDNPCAVVGNGLVQEGDIAISLGTSDTALSVIPRVPAAPLPFGHLFPHPILKGCYWSMLCYTNGDVTRRKVRDEFFPEGSDSTAAWEGFSQALKDTPPGNSSSVGMFFTTDEITPAVSCGADFRGRRRGKGASLETMDSFDNPKQNARAVIEMRAMAIRNHLEKLMPGILARTGADAPQLLLTGGASSNVDILQVFADVFQRPVRCMENTEGAAFGAAVRALHGVKPEFASDIFAKLRSLSSIRAQPTSASAVAYLELAETYAALEAKALSERGRL